MPNMYVNLTELDAYLDTSMHESVVPDSSTSMSLSFEEGKKICLKPIFSMTKMSNLLSILLLNLVICPQLVVTLNFLATRYSILSQNYYQHQ